MFTFSVGQHNYDVTPLQWIACANKGKNLFSRLGCIHGLFWILRNHPTSRQSHTRDADDVVQISGLRAAATRRSSSAFLCVNAKNRKEVEPECVQQGSLSSHVMLKLILRTWFSRSVRSQPPACPLLAVRLMLFFNSVIYVFCFVFYCFLFFL